MRGSKPFRGCVRCGSRAPILPGSISTAPAWTKPRSRGGSSVRPGSPSTMATRSARAAPAGCGSTSPRRGRGWKRRSRGCRPLSVTCNELACKARRPHLHEMNKKLRIGSYNIRKGLGTDWRRDPGRVLNHIAELQPDLIALQEADFRLGARPAALARGLIRERTGLVPLAVGHE